MALANIAFVLSKWGHKVLVIDWDLEAPGLKYFFKPYLTKRNEKQTGVLDLLVEMDLLKKPLKNNVWKKHISKFRISNYPEEIHFISTGAGEIDYHLKLFDFDIRNFYEESDGGMKIEEFRNVIKDEYDFVLIDSRTGVTDVGGICTVQLPDALILLLTANDQNVDGTVEISNGVLKARDELPFDRYSLLTLPVPSKFDSSEEFVLSKKWLSNFSDKFKSLFKIWFPIENSKLELLEQIKIPYVPYYSYGEQIAVAEQGTTDPQSIGYAYETIAGIISNNFERVPELMESRSSYLELASSKGKIVESDPFIFGAVVPPQLFFNRKTEVDWIAERIIRYSSVSIIGESRIGKTSILLYLIEKENKRKIFGKFSEKISFSFIDGQRGQITGATEEDFWEAVLLPFEEFQFSDNSDKIEIYKKFSRVRKNRFENVSELFELIKELQRFFVLVIDEFGGFLQYYRGDLNLLFGRLRSYASIGGLQLVVASRRQLSEFMGFEQITSPFFNVFSRITLGNFSRQDSFQLLARGGNRISKKDFDTIYKFSGGQPYILQGFGSKIWQLNNSSDVKEILGTSLNNLEAASFTSLFNFDYYFENSWDAWPKATQSAISIIVLSDVLGFTRIRFEEFSNYLVNRFSTIISDLELRGLVAKDKSDYRISSELLYNWVLKKLRSIATSRIEFEDWIADHGLLEFLSISEQEEIRSILLKQNLF